MTNVISMTELQKLSLKKLQRMKLPLYVIDRKTGRKAFMISGPETEKTATIPNYRNMGLLWDRPDLDNQGFHERLKDEKHPENIWAVTRLLERARSEWVKQILTLDELKKYIPRVRLRRPFQEAWNLALLHWTQTS